MAKKPRKTGPSVAEKPKPSSDELESKLIDMCSRFPALCQQVEALKNMVQEKLPATHSLSLKAWDEAESCPTCKAVKDEIATRIRGEKVEPEIKPEPEPAPTPATEGPLAFLRRGRPQ